MNGRDLRNSVLSGNSSYGGGDHTYLIGGNALDFFAVGQIAAEDDFYLIGAEPAAGTEGLPLLTGTLLDPRGHKLCRIVRNYIDANFGNVSRIQNHERGYEIRDRDGGLVLGVSTRFTGAPGSDDGIWVTTLEGRFHNARGDLVMTAEGEGGGGNIQMGQVGVLLGNLLQMMAPAQVKLARAMLASHGGLPGPTDAPNN